MSARRKWECTNRSSAQQVSLVNCHCTWVLLSERGQSLPAALLLTSAQQAPEAQHACCADQRTAYKSLFRKDRIPC